MKRNKRGVSLIVLVITIIVMIILAGTIILTLDNTGVIDRANEAVEKTNLAEVQNLASLKWAEAFIDGKTTQRELETEVLNGLNKEKIDLSPYNITVTDEGVTVALKGETGTTAQIPEAWKASIVSIVDTVPIPKGFVASSATGENTKNGGLVIYEGTEPVTDANVEDAKRTRNQYVWVPVEDFSKFVRQSFGRIYTTISNTMATDYWEVVLDTTTNMPLPSQSTSYMTSTTLAEVQAMYESVKEYKGFYIARYEAGIDVQRTEKGNASDLPGIKAGTTVYSVMGKIPYNYIPWAWNNSMSEDTNGAVEVARRIYPASNTNYGVVSTLTYGVQWDRTLAWWLEVGAKDGKGNTITSVTNSRSYGNYSDHVIEAGDLNDGSKYAVYDSGLGTYQDSTESSTKASKTKWALTTGALKVASVNNIYDMAGNMFEWTMEGHTSSDSSGRVIRGGSLYNVGYNGDYGDPVSCRGRGISFDFWFTLGFRHTLYIKK